MHNVFFLDIMVYAKDAQVLETDRWTTNNYMYVFIVIFFCELLKILLNENMKNLSFQCRNDQILYNIYLRQFFSICNVNFIYQLREKQ